MGHLNQLQEKPYQDLIERLNRYPVGAPRTEEMFEILNILYTKEEAAVGAKFPLGPATLAELTQKTGMPEPQLTEILESMAQKGVVLDFTPKDTKFFLLTPTIFGFFEFSFMRLNSDLPRGRLAELMDKLRPDMGREFFGSETQMSRSLVYEGNVADITSQVMPYDQVSELIRHSPYLSLQTCFCRHKAKHRGIACQSPLDVCMGLGVAAEFLIRRGFARQAAMDEMLHVLDKTEKLGLVHITDNVRDDPLFICHCCTCCCELLKGINELKIPHAVAPSRFMARIVPGRCSGCAVCARKCPVQAIGIDAKTTVVNQQRCLGCSVCVSSCKPGAISMKPRPNPTPTPKSQLIRHIKLPPRKAAYGICCFMLHTNCCGEDTNKAIVYVDPVPDAVIGCALFRPNDFRINNIHLQLPYQYMTQREPRSRREDIL